MKEITRKEKELAIMKYAFQNSHTFYTELENNWLYIYRLLDANIWELNCLNDLYLDCLYNYFIAEEV